MLSTCCLLLLIIIITTRAASDTSSSNMELMTHKGHNRVMSGEVTILTPGQGSETSFAADSSWGSTENLWK